jgi:tetratricopeptide (TPR) repeat protein
MKRGVDLIRVWLAELDAKNSNEGRNNVQGALGALLAHQAFFCFRLGRNLESQRLYEESIPILRSLDESASLAYALGHYGILRSLQGAYAEAVVNTREAIQLCRAIDDRWQECLYTTFLGMAIDDQGDYARAYQLFSEALQICRSLGDPRLISLAAGYLGQTAHTLGRFDEVPDLLREGLQAAAETNDRFGIALAGVRMALAAQSRGNGSVARRYLKESIQHFREAGDAWFLAHALNFEGKLALAAGESEQAEQSFREAGKVALTTQALPMLLDAMIGLAMLDAEQGQPERALLVVMHIVENPSSTHDTKNRSEKLRAVLLQQLTETQIESVKARLQHTSFDSLVHELL